MVDVTAAISPRPANVSPVSPNPFSWLPSAPPNPASSSSCSSSSPLLVLLLLELDSLSGLLFSALPSPASSSTSCCSCSCSSGSSRSSSSAPSSSAPSSRTAITSTRSASKPTLPCPLIKESATVCGFADRDGAMKNCRGAGHHNPSRRCASVPSDSINGWMIPSVSPLESMLGGGDEDMRVGGSEGTCGGCSGAGCGCRSDGGGRGLGGS